MTNVQTVVVDEGSTQIKVCWKDQESGEIKLHIIPSNIGAERKWAENSENGLFTDNSYTVDGEKFFAFDGDTIVERERTNLERFQYSPANLVLVHEALRQAGFGGEKINVLCTLPVSQYYKPEGGVNTDKIERKKQNLMRKIENANGLPLAEIVSCKVSSESTPAWHDQVIDSKLKVKKELTKLAGIFVVDIGGTTTDMMLMNSGGVIIKRDSTKTGVFEVFRLIRKNLAENKGIASITDVQMRFLIENHEFRGENVTAEINQAIREVKGKIVREMLDFHEHAETLDRIVFAGGGAGLFGKKLAEDYCQDAPDMNNVIICEDPQMAVARGLLKSVLRAEARQAKETA